MQRLITLTEASLHDTMYRAELRIDPDQIESVRQATVGERGEGAIVRTKSGAEHRVWETVQQVYRRMEG